MWSQVIVNGTQETGRVRVAHKNAVLLATHMYHMRRRAARASDRFHREIVASYDMHGAWLRQALNPFIQAISERTCDYHPQCLRHLRIAPDSTPLGRHFRCHSVLLVASANVGYAWRDPIDRVNYTGEGKWHPWLRHRGETWMRPEDALEIRALHDAPDRSGCNLRAALTSLCLVVRYHDHTGVVGCQSWSQDPYEEWPR